MKTSKSLQASPAAVTPATEAAPAENGRLSRRRDGDSVGWRMLQAATGALAASSVMGRAAGARDLKQLAPALGNWPQSYRQPLDLPCAYSAVANPSACAAALSVPQCAALREARGTAWLFYHDNPNTGLTRPANYPTECPTEPGVAAAVTDAIVYGGPNCSRPTDACWTTPLAQDNCDTPLKNGARCPTRSAKQCSALTGARDAAKRAGLSPDALPDDCR